jgi:hypothetical protein
MKPRAALPLSAVAVGLALALSPAQAAQAQETAPKTTVAAQTADQPRGVTPAAKASSARIVPTGSNIVRYRSGESLPLMEIDRTYIDRSGASTTPELLRTIPQLQVGR